MSDTGFDQIADALKEHPGSPTRLYVDMDNYRDLLRNSSFLPPDNKPERARLFGLEVCLVPNLEQEMMILDHRNYPLAGDIRNDPNF